MWFLCVFWLLSGEKNTFESETNDYDAVLQVCNGGRDWRMNKRKSVINRCVCPCMASCSADEWRVAVLASGVLSLSAACGGTFWISRNTSWILGWVIVRIVALVWWRESAAADTPLLMNKELLLVWPRREEFNPDAGSWGPDSESVGSIWTSVTCVGSRDVNFSDTAEPLGPGQAPSRSARQCDPSLLSRDPSSCITSLRKESCTN